MRGPKLSSPPPSRDERVSKRQKTQGAPIVVSADGPFQAFCIVLVPGGVSAARLNIWRRRIEQLGGTVHVADSGVEGNEKMDSWKARHIVAADYKFLEKLGWDPLSSRNEGRINVASFQWLQDSLEAGRPLPVDRYSLTPSRPPTTPADHSKPASQAPSPGAPSPPPSPPTPASSLDTSTVPNTTTTTSSSCSHEDGGSTGAGPGPASAPERLAEGQQAVERQRMWEEASPGMALYRPPDLNADLTRQFKELMHIYKDALGDEFRWFSYYKAISAVEKLPFRVTDARQLADVAGVGASIAGQVAEFVAGGRIERLEALRSNEEIRVRALFSSVWGIGPAVAKRLYERGHRSLEDLESEPSLTHAQRVGLRFHEDISARIPRAKIVEMETLLQREAEAVCPGVSILCGGSFRRGAASSGDLDMVATHADGHSHRGFLRRLLGALRERGFLTEDLLVSDAHSEEDTGHGVDTYFGLCHYVVEQRHRIDIKVYPLEQYPFGLIAWTGNDVLNRQLRILAEQKGYKLDDHGLFPASLRKGGIGGERLRSTHGIRLQSEHEVFQFLGHPWLEPHERNL